jgi:hypothetical protein
MIEDVLGALCTLVLVIVYAGIMFIPTYVAFYRRHEHRLAIGIVNFLLGWTGIGWAATMVWALTEEIFSPAVAGTQIGPRPGAVAGTGD